MLRSPGDRDCMKGWPRSYLLISSFSVQAKKEQLYLFHIHGVLVMEHPLLQDLIRCKTSIIYRSKHDIFLFKLACPLTIRVPHSVAWRVWTEAHQTFPDPPQSLTLLLTAYWRSSCFCHACGNRRLCVCVQ